MRYRDLVVATLSLAICEMQARSTTLFGFVTAVERCNARRNPVVDGDNGVRPRAPRAERRPLTKAALGPADHPPGTSSRRPAYVNRPRPPGYHRASAFEPCSQLNMQIA